MSVMVLDERSPACEEFLASMPGARLCHTQSWSLMLSRELGYRSFYLVAQEKGGVVGVLPLTLVKSQFFGTRLISQAYSNYGGIISADEDSENRLYEAAVELARREGCSSVEFRSITPLPFDLQLKTGKVCMHLDLVPDPEEMWKGVRSEIRNRVRKAQNAGVVVESGGDDLLDGFYGVYTARMRELGTPPYPRKLMSSILRMLPGNSRIFSVRLGDKVIGSAFTIFYNGLAETPWVATRPEYNRISANMLLYWAAVAHYCRLGVKRFDFGRSTLGGPHYEFKRRWGARQVDLNYQYWQARPGMGADLTPNNPRYRWKIEAWKKLPLWATRILGPMISRSLP